LIATVAGGMKHLFKARLGEGAFRRLDASVGASGPHVYKYTESEPAEINKTL
jgi:hypothetical protein